MKVIDPTDAPPGYYAVLKIDIRLTTENENICRHCDWRKDCSGWAYRCMPHEIACDDGRTLKRNDGCSVVFKRRAETAQLAMFSGEA